MRAKPAAGVRQAVGAYEAAALMGVHFSTPAKMVAKGLLAAREGSAGGQRQLLIYDGLECEENYLDYDAKVSALGGKNDRRPRAWLHLRPKVLRRLQAVEQPIAFDDAIGVAEACEILHVHPSFIARMIDAGAIVGRATWAERRQHGTISRHFILSRRSCMENAKETRRLQATGAKVGRPRKMS